MKHPLLLTGTMFLSLLLALLIPPKKADAQSIDAITQAYSRYRAGDYPESAVAFEKAFQNSRSEAVIRNHYYNAACTFSRINDLKKAHYYLERSFGAFRKTEAKRPVSIQHLLTDADLQNYRESDFFKSLVNKYFEPIERTYMLHNELLFIELIDYLNLQLKSNTTVVVSDKTIYTRKEGNNYVRGSEFDMLWSFESETNSNLVFENCAFHESLVWGNPRKIAQYNSLVFRKCKFAYDINFQSLESANPPQFTGCTFMGSFNGNFNVSASKLNWTTNQIFFLMDSCEVSHCRLMMNTAYPMDVKITNNVMRDTASFSLAMNSSGIIQLQNNSFSKGNLFINSSNNNSVQIEHSNINNFILDNTSIDAILKIENSSIKRFLMRNSFFPDIPSSNVDWEIISHRRLGVLEKVPALFNNPNDIEYIDGLDADDISNGSKFKELTSLYSMFLNLYRSKSDIESYNKCFIAIKELQSERLEFLHNDNSSFESYFRWKLSQLLRFYVRYGTDPARAILISFYIIIAFGIFFFFFPSDWDRTSKGRLVENYRTFVEKNERGYIRPFFILVGGFGISLLNAITLSLNAFITLGFGNIPTHGIARYFCVLEGFMGWFLLSIFTVALINQVL